MNIFLHLLAIEMFFALIAGNAGNAGKWARKLEKSEFKPDTVNWICLRIQQQQKSRIKNFLTCWSSFREHMYSDLFKKKKRFLNFFS